MSDDELRIPVIQEELVVGKRVVPTERVRVRTSPAEHEVIVRDTLWRQAVEVTRVPVEREVTEAPPTRTENGVTIVPVVEERLIVEKRLFLVEEVHMRLAAGTHDVAMPTTLRRTQVDVERTPLTQQEDH